MIDFNPRLYGSMALAIAAGTDLPVLWVDSMLGRPCSVEIARPGHRYRLEEAELQNAMVRVGRGDLLGALSILRPRRNVTHAFFRWDDPAPFVVATWVRLRHVVSRGVRVLDERLRRSSRIR